ncbi:hypothetical protein [Streptomyces sp. NL15-2K]|uniref:hypothetical protein n=1 Tax=Streptomyces sp. NL15-2K TaxID=376149 RepID=UPI000F5741E5|nr:MULTISPECIES: hypothetical protein [Actinomycetes]WKX08684.1 hypothetical protein Q4V64_14785 [Kutzneria buriramensis]
MTLEEPVERSGEQRKQRSRELLVRAAGELRLGRRLGYPHRIRAWEREYRRYHATAPEERGRWHRLRTDLRDARIGPLPAPDHHSLTRHEAGVAPRLYQEQVGYNYGGSYELMWRTVGYRWNVGDHPEKRSTWFTLTVNADGAPEFRTPNLRDSVGEDGVFRADPAGWRALMHYVSETVARQDSPRKLIRLWQHPWSRDGVDTSWRDVH